MRPMPKARLAAVDGRAIDEANGDPEREIIAAWIDECIEPSSAHRSRPTTSDLLASLDAYCQRRRTRKVSRQRMTAILTDLLKPEKVGGRYPRQNSERVWPGYRIRDAEERREGK